MAFVLLQVVAVMAVQFIMAYHVRTLAWWKVVVLAYTVSGTCNQNLLSAQHEISHFLALKKPYWNKVLAVASNCPIVVPMATKFRQYHQEHHSHLVSFQLDLLSLGATCQHHLRLLVLCHVCVLGVRAVLMLQLYCTSQECIYK